MTEIISIIEEIIGPMGRLISANKKEPKGHVCVWNGNIVVEGKKVWYGDLDLTKETKKLQKIANEIGKTLYILREMDARFENEGNPKTEKAVAVINPLKLSLCD